MQTKPYTHCFLSISFKRAYCLCLQRYTKDNIFPRKISNPITLATDGQVPLKP
jgi:hypothetical protein